VAEESTAISPIHNLSALDSARLLLLNNSHAKETSELDDERLAALLGMAFYARGVDRGATAFLVAFDHNAAYKNQNFEWFKARRQPFVYIDRVVVAETARGRGIAKALYDDLFAEAKLAGHERVVCEVNIDPPNPASEAFHSAMGFTAVGQAAIHNGTKTVRYFEKTLA
jgi:predicted GNAT superfamily acetyltransferase